MHVKISHDLAENEAHFFQLNGLLRIFLQGRHIWDFESDAVFLESAWFLNEGEYSRELKFEALGKLKMARAYGIGSATCRVTSNCEFENDVPIECCETCLLQPLLIVVEDGISDKAFLDCLVDAFGRLQLKELLRKQWMQVEHAGGITRIENHIRQLKSSAVQRDGADVAVQLRVYVFVDNDKRYPADDVQAVNDVARFCDESRIPITVLKKRAIENYLPPIVVEKWAKANEKENIADAFLRLSPVQRDFLHMKKGISSGRAVRILRPEGKEEL